MTQIAALAKELLSGRTVTIMSAFKDFACTNFPREGSRSIEKKFGVKLDKTPIKFKSRYGHPGVYYRYTLPLNDQNISGISLMIDYVLSQNKK